MSSSIVIGSKHLSWAANSVYCTACFLMITPLRESRSQAEIFQASRNQYLSHDYPSLPLHVFKPIHALTLGHDYKNILCIFKFTHCSNVASNLIYPNLYPLVSVHKCISISHFKYLNSLKRILYSSRLEVWVILDHSLFLQP